MALGEFEQPASEDAVGIGRSAAGARRLAVFEDRYGEGAHQRLLELLRQPCVTFADIAAQFGVSRERVRQWHLQLLPQAPRGRERKRLCRLYHQRRRLLTDPLFRSFHRHARAHFGTARIQLIRSRTGYSARAVRIDGAVVALRSALHVGSSSPRAGAKLPRYRGRAAFVYFDCGDGNFAFVPASIALSHTLFRSEADAIRRFANSFVAFDAECGQ